MIKYVLPVVAMVFFASPALGQTIPARGAEEVFGPAPPNAPYTTIPKGTPINIDKAYIPLAVPGTSGGYLTVGDVIDGATGILDPRIDRLDRRISETTALASSITIMPPNPGDRFSLTLSGATFQGESAVSGSASFRLDSQVLAFGAVAHGSRQTLGKGGVSLSFH